MFDWLAPEKIDLSEVRSVRTWGRLAFLVFDDGKTSWFVFVPPPMLSLNDGQTIHQRLADLIREHLALEE